jgi:hypothetical protein
MDSVKGNYNSFTGTNELGRDGDRDAITKDITSKVPVTITEEEITEENKAIDVRRFSRPLTRAYLATAKAVSYLMLRRN